MAYSGVWAVVVGGVGRRTFNDETERAMVWSESLSWLPICCGKLAYTLPYEWTYAGAWGNV